MFRYVIVGKYKIAAYHYEKTELKSAHFIPIEGASGQPDQKTALAEETQAYETYGLNFSDEEIAAAVAAAKL